MDKETLLSQFRAKVGESNLSDRTFSELTDQFLPLFADDTKITDETWNMPLAVFKSMSGQLRHDLSDGINNFKTEHTKTAEAEYLKKLEEAKKAFEEEWKKNHPDTSQQQQQQQNQNGDMATLIAEAVKKQMESITGAESDLAKSLKTMNEFMTQQAQQKKDADIASAKQAIKNYLLNDRKADKEPVVNLAIERLAFGDTFNVDELKLKAEKIYESTYKEFFGDGATPFGGNSTGGTGGADTDLKAYIEAQKKQIADTAAMTENVRKSFQ